jgi:hypothetical protein
MKEKILLRKALSTLFYSWGGDTPSEVYWGANDLLVWFEAEFDVKLGIRFERDEETFEDNFGEVMKVIDSL